MGREAELRALTTALDDTAASGRVIVVLGEGGIGKSTLIDQALSRAGSERVVLRAGADAMDQRRPLGLLLDAYASLLTDDDRRIVDERNAHAVAERLLAVTDSVATSPTALVLEDLQWADDASLALLTRVSRTLAQLPLLIVCSLRTQARHETSPALDHLLSVLSERGLLSQIEVPRLPDATCVTIVERLTGGRVEGALAHYVEAAGGNPLFLTEMVRSLLRDDAVTIAPDGQAKLVAAPVGPSPSLSMVMMRHLSHLGAATREMLTTAALLGTRFSVAQLRVVAGQPMSALLPMLRETFAAGFLEEIDADTLGFRHELIQEVLLQDLPAAVRAELHREVAVRMDAAGVTPATVAGHLLQAPVSPEDLDWMLQLAQRTAVAAPLMAAELWERVAHHADAGEERHVRATAGLARAALSSGRAAEASSLAERALSEEVPADVLPALTLTYTHALMQQHRHVESQQQSQRWALSELIEPADRAAHLAFAGWPRLMLGDLDGAKRLATEGAALAAEVGNHGAQVTALALHGQIADFQGDLDTAVALLSTAAETADRHPSLAAIEAFPHAQLALALADAGRTDGVAALVQQAVRVSEEFGYRTGMVAAHAFGAQALSSTGNLSDITAELDAHQSLLSGTMDVRMIGPVLGLRACMVARQHGPAAAIEFAELLDPVPDRSTWAGRGRAWIWRGLSQRDRAREDHAAALEVLWTGWQDCLEADMLMECAELGLDLVLLSRLVAGIRPAESRLLLERAQAASDLLAAFADRNPGVTYLRATALVVRGVLDGSDAVLEAERLMATTPRRLDHARLAEVAARAMPTKTGDRRMLAETALREYAEIGADHEVTRARAGFRKLGIPVLSPPRTRPTFGWESLTRTEERVAAQLATGATNPQIAQRLNVSRRTVETHVSSILAKLGLRTRTEVAVFVARRLDDVGEHGE
nr:LuxR family transcriptional regulator [Microbacterium sp. MAH-37]